MSYLSWQRQGCRRGGTWLSLCILLLWSCHGRQLRAAAMDDDKMEVKMQLETPSSTSGSCWVFSHLQKSGGTTIKNIIADRWGRRHAIYDSKQWLGCDGITKQYAKSLKTRRFDVVAGGYTEALRPYIGKECQWFTMFRHPVPRLVSAYYYCKAHPDDWLCASEIVRAKDITLVEFARHWGNFAVRQFALNFVKAEEVVDFVEAGGVVRDEDDALSLPGWYLLKSYLEHQGSLSGRDEEAVMMDMMHPIRDLIRDNFTAVAILEDFDTSLGLLNSALGVPDLDWKAAFRSRGVGNPNQRYHNVEKAMLHHAWTDSDIKDYIGLDLLLYEQAVDVFRRQAGRHGLL